jgi:hypothetical protein
MKVVINRRFGGFNISPQALARTKELTNDARWHDIQVFKWGKKVESVHLPSTDIIPRHDPILVQVVEELGEASYGWFSKLLVVEIPDNTPYEIKDYDGMESIHQTHRSWP